MALPNLKTDNQIQEQGDTLGGGARLLESGVYDMLVDMAYLDMSKSGAYSVVVTLKDPTSGQTVKETFWVTNNAEKGQVNYYIDKKGVKQYLPGFTMANHLALLTTGKEIGDLEPEEKMVNIYNYDLKKEVPTAKQVFTEMINKPIKVGILKVIVDKTQKNEATGVYEPTGETREDNEIDKFFDADTGATVAELRAGETEGTFISKWEDKWAGKVKNKAKGTKETGAKPGTPKQPAKKKSLFGNKAA